MFNWKAENQILLDENVGGKGRHFSTRFLEPGLVKYSFGVCLLEKETIDRFIYNFVGCPVIINHKDVTNESAKDDRVGVISRVWFNETDGWYWGEGVIFEQEALDLIDKGFNVSCQYEISEYSSNGGVHNGNEYDKVILNGKPEHLAIVQNPRYENAMIAVNAMEIEEMQAINEEKKEFVTVGEGESAHAIPVDYLKKDKKETTTKQADKKENKQESKLLDFNKKLQEKYAKEEEQENKKVTSTYKQSLLKEYKNIKENIRKDILDKSKRIDSLLKFAKDKPEEAKFHIADAEKLFKEIEAHENEYKYASEQIQEVLKLEEKPKKQETSQLKLFSKNDIIQAINEIKGLDMFKNLFKKKEKNMDKDEIKSIFMECLTELTASNEAEKKEEVKEEVKEEKEEVAENKCKNEEPDYKKMYEDLKAKCEAKEEKEKAKNAIDEQKELLNSGKVETKIDYITEKRAKELGKELF